MAVIIPVASSSTTAHIVTGGIIAITAVIPETTIDGSAAATGIVTTAAIVTGEIAATVIVTTETGIGGSDVTGIATIRAIEIAEIGGMATEAGVIAAIATEAIGNCTCSRTGGNVHTFSCQTKEAGVHPAFFVSAFKMPAIPAACRGRRQ
ncbi:MAG: hypothetical protein QHC90_26705 [Shinella sp.]|nr:hypothetical protein [Shinella sp.]